MAQSELDIGEIAWVEDTEAVLKVISAINFNNPKATAVVSIEQKKILGTVTDGDLRRAFLQNVTPDDPASLVMARSVSSRSPRRAAAPGVSSWASSPLPY